MSEDEQGFGIKEIDRKDVFEPCQFHDMSREESKEGYFDFVMISDSTYKLRWGTSLFERLLPDTFHCNSSPVAHPTLKEESSNYLVATFGCGSPCWGAYVLPLNKEADPKFVMYQYAFDLDRDIVVYLDSFSDEPALTIENLNTGERFDHRIDARCQAAIPTFCLNEVKIEENELILEWNFDAIDKEIEIERIKIENVLQQRVIENDSH